MNDKHAHRSALIAATLVFPIAASAHHSRVEYTGGEMIEIEGEVVRVVWRNPHIMYTVRSVAANGTTTDWVLEGPGATSVRTEGLVDGYVSVGDRVQAAGQRSDRRETWLRLAHIYFHDGKIQPLEEVVVLMAHHQLGRELPEAEVNSIVAFLGSLRIVVDR